MSKPFDLSRFKTSAGSIVRDGRHIETATLETPARKKREPFKASRVVMPTAWTARLQGASGSAKDLAYWILKEAYERKHKGGEVVLSTAATGISRPTRWRAVGALVALGLIEVEQYGREAPRVTKLLNLPSDWNHAPAELL